jgi:hypothetical protein
MSGVKIAIEAPDAVTALALEKRLRHLHPTSVGTRGHWLVDVDDAEDRLDEIVAAVHHWLGECSLEATTIRVDGSPRRIERTAVAAGAMVAADYEGGEVLAHEP